MELRFSSKIIEREVRRIAGVDDRPLTLDDAERVTFLDVSCFQPDEEDMRTLMLFRNLKEPQIDLWTLPEGFWGRFPRMDIKTLAVMLSGRIHDTQAIGRMAGLRELTLYSVTVESLDFLDLLPGETKVELDEVRVLSPVDMSRLMSLRNVSFSDLSVRSGSAWETAERSVL